MADTFVAVAEAATGSRERGERLSAQFLADIARISAICQSADVPTPAPAAGVAAPRRLRCALLEWADPPFDGGHWIPELTVAAGLTPHPRATPGAKSAQLDPEELSRFDPDLLVVACCGFDLARNVADAQTLWEKPWFRELRCVQAGGRVFAADGNRRAQHPPPPSIPNALVPLFLFAT